MHKSLQTSWQAIFAQEATLEQIVYSAKNKENFNETRIIAS